MATTSSTSSTSSTSTTGTKRGPARSTDTKRGAARSTGTTCSRCAPQADTGSPSSPTMVAIVDGWMREPEIRAFVLIVIAMVLIGVAIIVGLATGAIGDFINTILPGLLAKAIAGAAGTVIGGGAIMLIRRRRRIKRQNNADPAAGSADSADSATNS